VPTVFFSVACFVLLVNALSLQTAFDVRRMTIMEQENITDPLTGLYNRRYLERHLNEEIAKAYRYDLPLSALMLDIDHFKKTNDTYGHLVGDRVLKKPGETYCGYCSRHRHHGPLRRGGNSGYSSEYKSLGRGLFGRTLTQNSGIIQIDGD